MPDLPKPVDDGLPTPSVGEWSRDKHHFLKRYLDAFVTAMRKKPWSSLHYIDLFCGPGLLKLRDSNELIWGSPMIAAFRGGFDSIHLCDKEHEHVDAVRERIGREAAQTNALYYEGDANVEVHKVANAIPSGSLSVAFLDPYGLHVYFSTLEVLATRRVDLIVYFPDRVDILRNWKDVYIDDPDSNLDRVLGHGCDWRSIFKTTPSDRWVEELRERYVQQIRKLGYKCFEYQRIEFGRTPGYCLIFCSHHPAGAKIWRGISEITPGGQRMLPFA